MRRALIAVVEVVILSALIVATRCANYRDVFIGGDVYFTDADCYARMTRVRLCLEHPGKILRHHAFENFPVGTTPHTTAPFDYLVAGLSSAMPRDFAGALVSPLLALLTGWFLWWWYRHAGLPYRGALLLLFALSPILVHGTELGRPDHQSLLISLIAVALCAEWSLATNDSREWSFVSGAAWGMALWVSLYEPLILLAVLVLVQLLVGRKIFLTRNRLIGWGLCGGLVLLALLIERRLPFAWPNNPAIFSNWAATIGELRPIWPNDPAWLRWTGLLLIPLPALLWIALRRRTIPAFLAALLAATFSLTIWQARWAYFFAMIFAFSLPVCLSLIKSRIAGWVLIVISFFPILKDWDEKLWPNEFQSGLIAERRADAIGWRQMAKQIDGPFLAPWWWSPAVAYWSGQPGVAGSSHEALPGIEQSAQFFLTPDAETAKSILIKTKVTWVLAYDADRTAANSAAIQGISPPEKSFATILDRTPSQAPAFLHLTAQNSACKLFRVQIFHEKEDFRR